MIECQLNEESPGEKLLTLLRDGNDDDWKMGETQAMTSGQSINKPLGGASLVPKFLEALSPENQPGPFSLRKVNNHSHHLYTSSSAIKTDTILADASSATKTDSVLNVMSEEEDEEAGCAPTPELFTSASLQNNQTNAAIAKNDANPDADSGKQAIVLPGSREHSQNPLLAKPALLHNSNVNEPINHSFKNRNLNVTKAAANHPKEKKKRYRADFNVSPVQLYTLDSPSKSPKVNKRSHLDDGKQSNYKVATDGDEKAKELKAADSILKGKVGSHAVVYDTLPLTTKPRTNTLKKPQDARHGTKLEERQPQHQQQVLVQQKTTPINSQCPLNQCDALEPGSLVWVDGCPESIQWPASLPPEACPLGAFVKQE